MKKINLIQLGGTISLEDLYDWQLGTYFDYYWITEKNINNEIEKHYSLFSKHGLMNDVYRNAVFILDKTSCFLKKENILQQLPANRTLFEQDSTISITFMHTFKLKNFQFFKFNTNFSKQLIDDFAVKPEGSKLGMNDIYFAENFNGDIIQNGNDNVSFKGQVTEHFTKVLGWSLSFFYGANSSLEFYPEYSIDNDETELLFKIQIFDSQSRELCKSIEIIKKNIDDVKPTPVRFEKAGYIYVSVYARGCGDTEFSIGQCHFLPNRHGYGDLSFGGESIVDTQHQNGRILFYFDAGDMKPPLNVYFGGFNRGDFFEGYGMMHQRKSPFILVSDTRMIGGAFYIGSSMLEFKLVNYIKEKLSMLGFNNNQLILSGLSMGTFGALYYASDLKPRAVVVGKPLTNLGDIALNEKVNRPGGFPESLDLLLSGRSSLNAATEINKKFWGKFKENDFKNTTFIISYMKQDDYDQKAFARLSKYLKRANPNVKILHKGLIGRHNDDTNGIVKYFIKQLINLMNEIYGEYRTLEE